MVFIFAKDPDDALAGLAKELDAFVAQHQDQQVAAVINFFGDQTDDFRQRIKEFAEKNNIRHIALTVTADTDKFRVNEEAFLTVMCYKRKRVTFNYACTKDALNKETVQKVLEGCKTLLP